jgi:hypothetical protein
MDREADSFDVFEQLQRVDARFVIRVRDARNRVTIAAGQRVSIGDLARNDAVLLTRTVAVPKRAPSGIASKDRIHPPRRERAATLTITARRVSTPRPTDQSRRVLPRHLDLNMVEVEEREPPDGIAPVSWFLFTNEPIETADDVAAIVDAYRARWQIEEYFKALKTGCAFEQRQLETYHALQNALAVFAVVAWRLLLLRATERLAADGPARAVLTRDQVAVLTSLAELRDPRFARVRLPERPTVKDACLAVAALGGHLKNNGPPGWQVLGRGYDALLLLEAGWRARDAM